MAIWIVVANAARARIFAANAPADTLTEVEDLVHPASRLHGRDLESDAHPRVHDSFGSGRHAIEPSTDVKAQEEQAFARELAEFLQNAHDAGRYRSLYLIAGPHFLGLMRAQLSKAVSETLALTLDADLTQQTPKDIRAHLPTSL